MDNRSFDVMRNRMTNGKYFSAEAAKARIARLLDELEITQEQADALKGNLEAIRQVNEFLRRMDRLPEKDNVRAIRRNQ